MSDDVKHFPWNAGLPTKPDVDALMRAYPPEEIKPGRWRVTDDEVRSHIGRADGDRYCTVYTAWIGRLKRDHGVIVFREKLTGFFCPTQEEVFESTHPWKASMARKAGKQFRMIALVKPENELQRTVQNHQVQFLSVIRREIKKVRVNILPSTASPNRPRIEPPSMARHRTCG